MIIADDYVWATPARCGSHTCDAIADKMGWKIILPGRHRMDVPAQYQWMLRRITVRNPYDRLESMYRHLYDPKNYAAWHHWDIAQMDFPQFIHFMATEKHIRQSSPLYKPNPHRSPDHWVMSLTENATLLYDGDLTQVSSIRLENLWDDVGINSGDWRWKRPHRNGWAKSAPIEWTPEAIQEANENWCYADCRMFGYQLREAHEEVIT